MFFKTLLATTAVALFAAQAMAAPPATTNSEVKAVLNETRDVRIAPDAISACNCPNNCRHRLGDSCKFYREGYILTRSKCFSTRHVLKWTLIWNCSLPGVFR